MPQVEPDREIQDDEASVREAEGKSAHDPYAALRVADYRRFLAASVISTIGGEMQAVAVGWELYERTSSAMALGIVGLVLAAPVVALALPAGHLADRVSRRNIILATHGLMAAASLGLAALSFVRGPILGIYACLLLMGTAIAYSLPAKWAFVPQLVPKGALTNAITWNSSGWQMANVAGPALGGRVIGPTGGATGAYLLDVACCLAVLAVIGTIADRPAATDRGEEVTREALLAGLGFVRRTKLLLATLTMDLFAVFLGGATMLLPIFARDILHVGPSGLGWLRAAPSVGAVAMAMAIAHRPPMRRAGPSLLWAVAGFGAATIVFGLSRNYWLSLAMLAMTGALDNISVVVRATLLQVLTPDAMRGRVSAINGVFIGASNELGGFESGVAASLLGPVLAVALGGVGSILVVLGVAVVWPEVRWLRSLEGDSSEDLA